MALVGRVLSRILIVDGGALVAQALRGEREKVPYDLDEPLTHRPVCKPRDCSSIGTGGGPPAPPMPWNAASSRCADVPGPWASWPTVPVCSASCMPSSLAATGTKAPTPPFH